MPVTTTVITSYSIHYTKLYETYLAKAVEISPERPVLIDRFLPDAVEVEADAVSDGTDAFVPASHNFV